MRPLTARQMTSRYRRCQRGFPSRRVPRRPVATLLRSEDRLAPTRAAPAPALASSTQIAPITSTLAVVACVPPVTSAETQDRALEAREDEQVSPPRAAGAQEGQVAAIALDRAEGGQICEAECD